MSEVLVDRLPLIKVLVKFYTYPPEGSQIPLIQRDDREVEARHAQDAKDLKVDFNRYDRGKGDSGVMIADAWWVSLEPLIPDLKKLGFRLVDVHQEFTRKANRPGERSSVIVFVYALEGEEIVLSDVDREWFEKRIQTCHEKVAIWKNPQRVTPDEPFTYRCDTINLRASQGDQKVPPKVKLGMPRLGAYSDGLGNVVE